MYESRPMGTAVISVTDLFKRRDFRPQRRAPSVFDASYVGLCASLGDLNATLRQRRAALLYHQRRKQNCNDGREIRQGFGNQQLARRRTLSGIFARPGGG